MKTKIKKRDDVGIVPGVYASVNTAVIAAIDALGCAWVSVPADSPIRRASLAVFGAVTGKTNK